MLWAASTAAMAYAAGIRHICGGDPAAAIAAGFGVALVVAGAGYLAFAILVPVRTRAALAIALMSAVGADLMVRVQVQAEDTALARATDNCARPGARRRAWPFSAAELTARCGHGRSTPR